MADPSTPHNSRFVTALFLVVFVGSLLLLFRLLAVYLAAIILALVLVSLFYPLFTRICCRLGQRRRVAATLTTLLVVVVVLLPLSLVLTSLSAEAVSLYGKATTNKQPFVEQILTLIQSDHPMAVQFRDIADKVGMDLSPAKLREHAATFAATAARLLYEQLSGIASNAFRTLMHFGLMVVLIFALFADGPRLKAYLLDLSPLPDEQEEALVARFAIISRAVFLGNGVASVLQGIMGGLGFYLFGIGSGVLWGTAIAFFAFLPIVGATIVFMPATIYLFLQGHTGLAIGFLAYNMVYVSVFEYGLKPRLIGGQSQMSGVLVFMGILAGLSLFGILGLFYGPLILTMFLTLSEIYKSQYRNDLMAVRSPWVRSDSSPWWAGGLPPKSETATAPPIRQRPPLPATAAEPPADPIPEREDAATSPPDEPPDKT